MKSGATRHGFAGATFVALVFLQLGAPGEASQPVASQPVLKAITGCVRSGKLWVEEFGGKYWIHARDAIHRPDLGLDRFEGKKLRFEHGYLLPGDIYVVQSAATVVGDCQ
ncbi:MAG: hypothetical protein ABR929_02485 [Roseiarcus sp.]|jgi:hypothetical protein